MPEASGALCDWESEGGHLRPRDGWRREVAPADLLDEMSVAVVLEQDGPFAAAITCVRTGDREAVEERARVDSTLQLASRMPGDIERPVLAVQERARVILLPPTPTGSSPASASDDEADAATLRLLRSSEHPVMDSFPHGAIFIFDHDLRYLSAGGRGLADVGLTRKGLEGRTIHEVFPADVATRIEPLYRAALAGASTCIDVPYAGRTFAQRLSPITNGRGVVLAGMGLTQDVTDARQAERQLRESEQRFRLAFEHAPIGKAVVDLDGRFREVNPALCHLTGYSAEVLETLTFQDITYPEDLDADLTQLDQLMRDEISSYSMEKRYCAADGQLVWVLLTVALVRGDDHRPLYFISQMQDINERKLREKVSADANEVRTGDLERAAAHDELTGLPNRRLVEQQLEALLEPYDRRIATHGLAVLYCDLDGFKAVNDNHGHAAGDSVLREVATRMIRTARSGDTVARLGGDEFVVLMPTRLDEDVRSVAATVASRICAAVAAPYEGITHPDAISISISIGIALAGGDSDPDGLLRKADAALYAAKKAGKNGFSFGGVTDAR